MPPDAGQYRQPHGQQERLPRAARMDGDEGFDELPALSEEEDAGEMELLRAKAFHFDRLMPQFQECRQRELALEQRVADLRARILQLEASDAPADCCHLSVAAEEDIAAGEGGSPPALHAGDNDPADAAVPMDAGDVHSPRGTQDAGGGAMSTTSGGGSRIAPGAALRAALASLSGDRPCTEFVRLAMLAVFKRQDGAR